MKTEHQLEVSESSEENVLIQETDLRKMIQRAKTGIDELRQQHLKQTVGFLSESDSDGKKRKLSLIFINLQTSLL
jgi:hypothetical protein